MTDAAFLGNPGPLAATRDQRLADFDVERGVHADTLAILCYVDKQHIAQPDRDHPRMEQNIARSALVDALAANLKTHMDRLALSQPQLAQKSGVGQTTIGLYLNPDRRLPGKSGKIPSPKLAEVDLLARALGVDPLALLSLDHGVHTEAHQASQADELSPPERDLVGAFRMLPEDSQLELLRDVMAQAERINKIVQRELERRGIAVTGYISATKAAEHLPAAPTPSPGWRMIESPVNVNIPTLGRIGKVEKS